MKRVLFLIFIMVNSVNSFSQMYKVYKDKHFYGLKEISSGKTLITPKYKRLYNFRDSLFVVVDSSDEEAIIDIKENLLVPFKKIPTGVIDDPDDSLLYGKLCEYPIVRIKKKYIAYIYQIDGDRKCIPNDYYICPVDKEVNYSNKDSYFKSIQNSIRYSSLGKIDSAIYESKKAIEIAPNKPPASPDMLQRAGADLAIA